MNKKLVILILIIFIEIALGLSFVNSYYKKNLDRKAVLGVSDVVKIDKDSTISSKSDDLKYYWSYLPNQIQKDSPSWLENEAKYNINSDGLNDLKDYSIDKSGNTFRIITLGDSFTFGHYVDTKDNWTEQLEIMLNKDFKSCGYDNYEVINLGMPGFDVQYIVQRYKELGQKYKPDLILWFESGSGFTRRNELSQPLLEKCIDEDYDLKLADGSRNLYPCASEIEKKIMDTYTPEEFDQMIIDELDTYFSLTSNSKTLFFYYENLDKNIEKLVGNFSFMYPQSEFISMVPDDTKNDRLLDGHPNIKGHQTITSSVFTFLKNGELVCP